MILGINGIIASSISGVDPDAAAFFARVTAAGGSLSATEKTAVNTLVITMKADGTWTPMKAIYPMVGASAAACAQNLKSSSFTGTFTSGWTFASTGVTGNGTSAFFDTNLFPFVSLTNSSGSFSLYSRTNVSESAYDFAAQSGGDYGIIARFSNNTFYAMYPGYGSTATDANSLGFYITNRNSSTNTTGFKNNTKVINSASTPILASGQSVALGAIKISSTTALNFSTKQYAFASIGDGLTDTQASNFYTAVQAFQTTLSRNV
jgi:hypothetical protein